MEINDQITEDSGAPLEHVYAQPYDHTKLKRMVETYLDVTRQNATRVQQERDYFDGDQLNSEVLKTLRERGSPEIWINQIAPGIYGVLGLIDSTETDPEAYPRTQASQDSADLVTKTLRFLADKTDYRKVRGQASENFIIEGTGAAIIDWDGRDIKLARIKWEHFIFDPYSTEHDFEDAKYLGLGKLLDEEDVRAMFPHTYDKLADPVGDFGNFFDDKSKAKFWGNPARRQVRVIDLYYEAAGDWHRAIFCQSGMLYAGKSEFLDDCGCTICPIVASSYEINRQGERYGIVRNMIPLQDEVNARRSRGLHLINHRQTKQTEVMVPAANKAIAKREAGKADGTIPYGFDIVQTSDMAQGQMIYFQQSQADLNRLTPTPAVLGRTTSAGESGRARQLLQQAGNLEFSRQLGRFEAWELTIYRKLWLAARQFLDQPTWVRITNDVKAPEFLMINEPVMGPVAKPVIDPQTGQPVIDPQTGQPVIQMTTGQVGTKNRIAELDMHIVISSVADTVTLQQENWATMLDYAKGIGISPFDPKFVLLLEMSPMVGKADMIEKIKRLTAEQQPQQDGAQQAMAQQALQVSQADVALKTAKAAKDNAHAAKTAIEATALGTSLSHILPPETIAAIIAHGQQALQGQPAAPAPDEQEPAQGMPPELMQLLQQHQQQDPGQGMPLQ